MVSHLFYYQLALLVLVWLLLCCRGGVLNVELHRWLKTATLCFNVDNLL